MYITKRTGISELYDGQKIINAISKAFRSTGNTADRETLLRLLASVEEKLSLTENKSVEVIQDLVEQTLMEHGCFAEAKSGWRCFCFLSAYVRISALPASKWTARLSIIFRRTPGSGRMSRMRMKTLPERTACTSLFRVKKKAR